MPSRRLTSRTLAALMAVMGVAAIGGSWMVLAARGGSEHLPLAWLDGSPFRDYLVPGLVLGIGIGGGYLAGAALVLGGHHLAGWAAAALGVELIGWIVIQVAIIGPASLLQPICAIWGVIVTLLGLRLARLDDARHAVGPLRASAPPPARPAH